MSPGSRLEEILRDPRVWQAGQATDRTCPIACSGWSQLDEALNGGWPLGQLTELLIDAHGIGEFTLLLPALRGLMARAGAQNGWAALVSAPHVPYAPALVQAGIDLSRLLLVRPGPEVDTLWAMEQVLRAQTCVAVMGWSGSRAVSPLRRLQLAAEASGAWAVLFRPAHARLSRSASPLRIHLFRERDGDRLMLSVIKRRGGPPVLVGVNVDE